MGEDKWSAGRMNEGSTNSLGSRYRARERSAASKQEAAPTGWQEEIKHKRDQQPANRSNKRYHSHTGKQTFQERSAGCKCNKQGVTFTYWQAETANEVSK